MNGGKTIERMCAEIVEQYSEKKGSGVLEILNQPRFDLKVINQVTICLPAAYSYKYLADMQRALSPTCQIKMPIAVCCKAMQC